MAARLSRIRAPAKAWSSKSPPPPAYMQAQAAPCHERLCAAREPAAARGAGALRSRPRRVETPCFMPVGTAASVKGLDAAGAARASQRKSCSRTRITFGCVPASTRLNAPAASIVSWRGIARSSPIPGGFQVFSLESRRRLDADGVTFASHLDGSEQRFTPENVIALSAAHRQRRGHGARRLRRAAGDRVKSSRRRCG